MTFVFIIIALGLTGSAVYFLLRPLLTADNTATESRSSNLITMYQEKLAVLQQQQLSGELDSTQYQQARQEIEDSLAGELPEQEDNVGKAQKNNKLAVILGVFIPITALMLYIGLGEPRAFSKEFVANGPSAQPHADISPEEAVAKLKEHLEDNPEDIESWRWLSYTYVQMSKFVAAAKATEQAMRLAPDNVELILDYAEILGYAAGNSLLGKAAQYVNQAYKLDPKSPRAQLMYGLLQLQSGDTDQALDIWTKAYQQADIGQDYKTTIKRYIEAVGGQVPEQAVSGPIVTVNINIDPALAGDVASNDTLFVYAKNASNKGPPLAIRRLTANQFPLQVQLDDRHAMMEQMKLSLFDGVVVSARISKTGQAISASGDLIATSDIINPQENPQIELVINSRVP